MATKSFTFDLSTITAAATADAQAQDAVSMLHADIVGWHAAGVFPAVKDVQRALIEGYKAAPTTGIERSDDTLMQYAYGIVKWAKAGRLPKALSLRAFTGSVPGAKGVQGRKARTATKTDAGVKASAGPTTESIKGALTLLRDIMAKRTKQYGFTADQADELGNALETCIVMFTARAAQADKEAGKK